MFLFLFTVFFFLWSSAGGWLYFWPIMAKFSLGNLVSYEFKQLVS